MGACRSGRRRIGRALGVSMLVSTVLIGAGGLSAEAASPRVLLVGTYHGVRGHYASIQAAVDAARRGDWVLVAPGDYHERGTKQPERAGVLIRTPGVHLRGMDRNRVIVDGTLPGAPGACNSDVRWQSKSPRVPGAEAGWNGVMAFEVSGVSIENLTVCNFLTSPDGEEGNEIWWNGGDGTGKILMHEFHGSYLSATSTYSNGFEHPRGEYGIFSSNSDGPGLIEHTYASNMGDAAFYIGACPNCNQVLRDAHGQNSALGFSGTNSGGRLIIENSEFDTNATGFVANSQNNDDLPSPQIGTCPGNAGGPYGNGSCTVLQHSLIHDNNNPNVPGLGTSLAGSTIIGTGVILAGTRYYTVAENHVYGNGAWGVIVVDLPDQEDPYPGAHCEGGIQLPQRFCYYQTFGNEVLGNVFQGNGFFGNPTNADLALLTTPHNPGNCFLNNSDPNGLTSDPPFIQSAVWGTCGLPNGGDLGPLAVEALCDSGLLVTCPNLPLVTYPKPIQVHLLPLPKQPTMPDPCRGVPANPWCPRSG